MSIFALNVFELRLGWTETGGGQILSQLSTGSRWRSKKFRLRTRHRQHCRRITQLRQRIYRRFKQIVSGLPYGPLLRRHQEAPQETLRRLHCCSTRRRACGMANGPELALDNLNLLTYVRHHAIDWFNGFHHKGQLAFEHQHQDHPNRPGQN